jgi:hypothetical protein
MEIVSLAPQAYDMMTSWFTYTAVTHFHGADTTTNITDTTTLAASTATSDNTATYGAYTTCQHQIHWCLCYSELWPPYATDTLHGTDTATPIADIVTITAGTATADNTAMYST